MPSNRHINQMHSNKPTNQKPNNINQSNDWQCTNLHLCSLEMCKLFKCLCIEKTTENKSQMCTHIQSNIYIIQNTKESQKRNLISERKQAWDWRPGTRVPDRNRSNWGWEFQREENQTEIYSSMEVKLELKAQGRTMSNRDLKLLMKACRRSHSRL